MGVELVAGPRDPGGVGWRPRAEYDLRGSFLDGAGDDRRPQGSVNCRAWVPALEPPLRGSRKFPSPLTAFAPTTAIDSGPDGPTKDATPSFRSPPNREAPSSARSTCSGSRLRSSHHPAGAHRRRPFVRRQSHRWGRQRRALTRRLPVHRRPRITAPKVKLLSRRIVRPKQQSRHGFRSDGRARVGAHRRGQGDLRPPLHPLSSLHRNLAGARVALPIRVPRHEFKKLRKARRRGKTGRRSSCRAILRRRREPRGQNLRYSAR